MTIRYTDGRTVDGFLLARQENSMRVALEGGHDVVEYIDVQGNWVSENLEPVKITFEWERRSRTGERYDEAAFVCPQELANLLLRMLSTGSEPAAEPAPRYLTAGQSLM
jgi:hypothetical protein